ncbi:MAG TPA: hypothetical protein VEQ59_22370, partial [Polyangiaceae bacterium]|nr:hypothetical protein [Polyangiaceae bacterium]
KPSSLGELVQSALIGYGGPHPAVEPEADTPLSFSFDHGKELWSLNDYQDPEYMNLGARTPPGAAPARLVFNSIAGEPTPGALELHLTISAKDQYVIAETAVVENLQGKTLHARVRLASGSLSGAAPSLHACAGANFSCLQGPPIDPARLASGEWVSLDWSPSTVMDPSFDVTQVTFVGVAVDASLSTDASLPETSDVAPARAEAVLEIDSFTD